MKTSFCYGFFIQDFPGPPQLENKNKRKKPFEKPFSGRSKQRQMARNRTSFAISEQDRIWIFTKLAKMMGVDLEISYYIEGNSQKGTQKRKT